MRLRWWFVQHFNTYGTNFMSENEADSLNCFCFEGQNATVAVMSYSGYDIEVRPDAACLKWLLYIELANSFLIGRKRAVNVINQRPWRHNCRLYNNHVKDTQGHGQSCQFAPFLLLPVSEEEKTWLPFFFAQCIIQQLLDSVFVICRIIKVEVMIILDITKTSSSSCLMSVICV